MGGGGRGRGGDFSVDGTIHATYAVSEKYFVSF